ncbi:MAG: glycosyltransferase family 39 protein [Deltaproteobacteria bacterium]
MLNNLLAVKKGLRKTQEVHETNKRFPYLLVIPIALALGLSLQNLGSDSLWLDEAWSVAIANLDWRHFSSYVSHRELNMALYYAVLKLWVYPCGDSESAARALSVVFSVCAIVMVYLIAVRLFDRRVGLAASLILATNAYAIQYSQEVKGYTLYLFLATASYYFFIDVLRNPRRTPCVLYVSVSALMVYNHFFGLLVLVSQGVLVPLFLQEKGRWRRMFLCAFFIAVLVAPVGLFIYANGGGYVLGWVRRPSFWSFVELFGRLSGDSGSRTILLAYFVFGVLSLVFLVEDLHKSGRQGTFSKHYALLLGWMLIPIAIAFAFSVAAKPVFVSRYLMASLAPLVILVAIGLSRIRNPILYRLAVCGFAVLSVNSVYQGYYRTHKDDWRSATKYVLEHSIPGDGVILYGPSAKFPFEYYYSKLRTNRGTLDCIYPSPFGLRDILDVPATGLLKAISGRRDRVWCVLWNDVLPGVGWDSRPALKELKETHLVEDEAEFRGIRILLFVKRGAGQRIEASWIGEAATSAERSGK